MSKQQMIPHPVIAPGKGQPAGQLHRLCARGNHTGIGGECVDCRQKQLRRKAVDAREETAVPPIVSEALRSPGRPLDPVTRAYMEPRFGHDFSRVRIHTDALAAESARAVNALAYTVGNHVVFGNGQYTPTTISGRRLLAHEIVHTWQQRDGSPAAGPPLKIGPANDHWEAEAERVSTALTTGAVSLVDIKGGAASIQFQNDRQALQARLQQVQERLAKLRQQYNQLSDEFADSRLKERQRESLQKGTADLQKQARSEAAANALWGGRFARERILKCASLSQSGATATVSANFQLSYLTLNDKKGRERAAVDIPRIERTIREVWQVDIASGEYVGISFRFQPTVTYLPKGSQRSENAFQIQVRGPDKEPSSGDSVSGVISLAPAHLEGGRVIVVAHELAHLFGFTDTYIQMKTRDKKGKEQEQWGVGRADPANRPDLLGMIDPDKLARLEKKGAVLPTEVKRQTGQVRVWEEEASIVLRVLGANPLPPTRPTPDSEDFDPADELERQRRQGEEKLARIREKSKRVENSMKSLEIAEEIIRLEKEEASLTARLKANP